MTLSTEIDRWRTPASDYPRGFVGRARVRTAWYPADQHYACYEQRGFTYYTATKRLYITSLEIDGKVWMVDDPPHWWAMEQHAEQYKGHVLCAGLGLGLMVHTLTANPAVECITVVEREQDVIDLISPHVPHDKLTIITGDFFEVTPDDAPDVDGVLFDLLVGDGLALTGAAIVALAHVYQTWGKDIVARVHGIPSSMIDKPAREIAEIGHVEATAKHVAFGREKS